MATDGGGHVYVADSGNSRVQKFDASGTFLTTWGSAGSGTGQFGLSAGVATDGSESVYVSDVHNDNHLHDRVQKFDASGNFLLTWGSGGQFDSPVAVATDTSGHVYVADTGNFRIQKFDAIGTFLTMWGNLKSEAEGVATNSTGDVYVSEFHAGIEKFDGSGTFLTAWSGGFNFKPVGVATDASGNVYVVDYGNNRVQKFACP